MSGRQPSTFYKPDLDEFEDSDSDDDEDEE